MSGRKPAIVTDLKKLLPVFDAAYPHLVRYRNGQQLQGRMDGPNAFPASGEADDLRLKLHAWARKYGMECPWVIDTALNTLNFWRKFPLHDQPPTAEERRVFPRILLPLLKTGTRKRLSVPCTAASNRAREMEPERFSLLAPLTIEDGETLSEYRRRLLGEITKAVIPLEMVENTTNPAKEAPAISAGWSKRFGCDRSFHIGETRTPRNVHQPRDHKDGQAHRSPVKRGRPGRS